MKIQKTVALITTTAATVVVALSLTACGSAPATHTTHKAAAPTHSASPAPTKTTAPVADSVVIPAGATATPESQTAGIYSVADVTFANGSHDTSFNGTAVHCDNDVTGNTPSGAQLLFAKDGSFIQTNCSYTTQGLPQTSDGW